MSDIKLASSAKIMSWALFLVLALFTIAIGLSPVLGKTFSMIVAVTVMWFADGFLSHKWPQIFPR